MTDKELRRLNRSELLELLLVQSKKIDELEAELESFKKQGKEQELMIEELGSIAEASLKINNVFETAQAAADQYLKNAISKCEQMKQDTEEWCQQERHTCVEKCKRMEAETKDRCKLLIERVQSNLMGMKDEKEKAN